MYNSLQEIQQDTIDILEGLGFKTSLTPFSNLSGYLKIMDKDSLYVYAKCNKFIEDNYGEESNSKKDSLVVRFTITIGTNQINKGQYLISFDYNTGGCSGWKITCKEETKKHIYDFFRCHNLYTLEELEQLEKENRTTNLFDFI